MCPIVLKPFPAVTDVGAKSVDAGGEGRADLQFVAFIHIPAFGAISFITIFALAVEGPPMLVALSQWVAAATSIQAGVPTHACALVIHQANDTPTCVGTRGVVACHVLTTSRACLLTFVDIHTNKAVTLVSILALTDVGPVCVAAQSLGATVVWQDGIVLTFIHVLAVKAIARHARWAGTVERSRRVSATGNWMASSILDLALIKVYNLSKMGQCQGNSPKWCSRGFNLLGQKNQLVQWTSNYEELILTRAVLPGTCEAAETEAQIVAHCVDTPCKFTTLLLSCFTLVHICGGRLVEREGGTF